MINKDSASFTDVHQYHEEIGHPNMAVTQETAKARGVKLEGQDQPCSSCAVSKAQKKKISKKEAKSRAELPAERLFLDISSQHYPSLGGNKHWLLALDDYSDQAFSFFLKEKSQTSEVVIPFLKSLHA